MNTSILTCRMGVLFYLVISVGTLVPLAASAQTTQQASSLSATPQASRNQAALQTFRQEQLTLIEERRTLVAQGATRQQLATWQQQNAAAFALQQQRAQAMATASAPTVVPTNRQPNIPANASQTLKDFLTTRTALANALAQIHNQLAQSSSSTASAAQISQMQEEAMQLLAQRHAADLQLQSQRAQTLATESSQVPMRPLSPLRIPPNATPQMAAFLTTRNQLMQSRNQFLNEYATATPTVRLAAMERWVQQNVALIQQMQQQAQSLSEAATTTVN